MTLEGDGAERGGTMGLDYLVAGLVSVALLGYLLFALVNPERF